MVLLWFFCVSDIISGLFQSIVDLPYEHKQLYLFIFRSRKTKKKDQPGQKAFQVSFVQLFTLPNLVQRFLLTWFGCVQHNLNKSPHVYPNH